MNTAAKDLIATFDSLSPADQHEVVTHGLPAAKSWPDEELTDDA